MCICLRHEIEADTVARSIDDKTFSKYFKAVGDLSRLRIITLLSAGELTVNEIAARVKLSQPTVSRHLSILREAGIVTARREGQQVFYQLNRDTVQNCCEGFCNCLQIRVKKPRTEKK
jgi:ArsR family transcriptional regulator, arsenate/arsenite/antimonite-responsive transcriptional repressor